MVANASMVYRIGANLDELRKNLAEGKAIIESVNADVSKLSGSGAAGVRRVRNEVDNAVKPTSEWHKAFQNVDSVLAAMGISIGTDVKALDELANASGKAAKGIGLIGELGLVAGAAIGGWAIGRKVSEFFDLDKAIGDTMARLMGFGDVAAETAGAKMDVLIKATKLAGTSITDLELATALLSGAAAENAKKLDTSANRIAGWRQEIAKVKADNNWELLTADLDSQNFSLDELSKRYGISTEAMQFFTRGQKEAADAVEASNKRMLDNLKNSIQANQEAREKAEKLAEAQAHLALAQGQYFDVLSKADPVLVEQIRHYQDLGLSVGDIATLLGQTESKVGLLTEALQKQNNVYQENHEKLSQLEKDRADQQAAEQKKREEIEATTKALKDQEEAAKKAREAMVYTHTYDLSTPEGMAEFKRLNPSASITGDALNPDYFKNHTLQDAINAGLIDLYAGFKNKFADGVSNFSGGLAIVGERGPELVNLPRGSNVIPNHQIPSATAPAVTVNVHVSGHIVGTQEQLGRMVGDLVMTHLRNTGTRFPVTRGA